MGETLLPQALRDLAKAIKGVVSVRHVKRTGKRYDVKDWKWIAARTARSLNKLADAIWAFREERAERLRRARGQDTTRWKARSASRRRRSPDPEWW